MKMKKVIALIMVALICVMTFAVTASASDDKPASSTTATSARAETPTGEAKWRGFMDLQWNRIPNIYEKKRGCLWYKEQMLCRFCVTKLENESATERVV